MKQSKLCTVCGNKYEKPPKTSQKVWEQRQFCSLSCFGKHAGNNHLVPYRMEKGTTLGEATQFKKGENKGAINPKWKGDKASYAAIHMWVNDNYGRPQRCDDCGTTEDRKYHWANISKEYKRERSDWLRLCVPCHKKRDIVSLGGRIKPRPVKKQPSKLCPQCGVEFFKNPHLSKTQWEGQTYCSRDCTGKATKQNTFDTRPSKQCVECGTVFYKETWTSRKNWAERQYCGRKCGSQVSARLRKGKQQSQEIRSLKSEKQRERWANNPELRAIISQKMRGNTHAARKQV